MRSPFFRSAVSTVLILTSTVSWSAPACDRGSQELAAGNGAASFSRSRALRQERAGAEEIAAKLAPAAGAEEGVVRVLIADTPQRPTVPGQIEALIHDMGLEGRVQLIAERGETGNQQKLKELIEWRKPAVILVFTGQKILIDPFVVQAARRNRVRLVIRAGAGYENFDMEAMLHYLIPFMRSHGLVWSMDDYTRRVLFGLLRVRARKAWAPAARDISQHPQLRTLFQMSPAVYLEALDQANQRKRGEMTPDQKDLIFGAMSREEFLELARTLEGQKIGILGFGAIGRKVAESLKEIKRLTGVSFEVIAAAPSLTDPASEEAVSALKLVDRIVDPKELFQTADIVTVHINSTAGNINSISPKSFEGRTKPLIFINTARENLVDYDLFAKKQPFQMISFGDLDYNDKLLGFRDAQPQSFFMAPHIGGLTAASAQGAIEALLGTLRTVFPVLLGEGDPSSIQTINRLPVVPVVRKAVQRASPVIPMAGAEESLRDLQDQLEGYEAFLNDSAIQTILKVRGLTVPSLQPAIQALAKGDLDGVLSVLADALRDLGSDTVYPLEDLRENVRKAQGFAFAAVAERRVADALTRWVGQETKSAQSTAILLSEMSTRDLAVHLKKLGRILEHPSARRGVRERLIGGRLFLITADPELARLYPNSTFANYPDAHRAIGTRPTMYIVRHNTEKGTGTITLFWNNNSPTAEMANVLADLRSSAAGQTLFAKREIGRLEEAQRIAGAVNNLAMGWETQAVLPSEVEILSVDKTMQWSILRDQLTPLVSSTQIHPFSTSSDAKDWLQSHKPHLILIHENIGGSALAELVQAVRRTHPTVPMAILQRSPQSALWDGIPVLDVLRIRSFVEDSLVHRFPAAGAEEVFSLSVNGEVVQPPASAMFSKIEAAQALIQAWGGNPVSRQIVEQATGLNPMILLGAEWLPVRDHPDQVRVASRLGPFLMPQALLDEPGLLRRVQAEVRGMKRRLHPQRILHFGMGGSAEVGQALQRAGLLKEVPAVVFDTSDPHAVAETMPSEPSTLKEFLRTSKINIMSMGMTSEEPLIWLAWLNSVARQLEISLEDQISLLTLDGSSVHAYAKEMGLERLRVDLQPDSRQESAGRMSGPVTTRFPLWFLGLNGYNLRKSVRQATLTSAEQNRFIALGQTIAEYAEKGKNKVTLVLPKRLEFIGPFLKQGWEESLGLNGKVSLGSKNPQYRVKIVIDEPRYFDFFEAPEKSDRVFLAIEARNARLDVPTRNWLAHIQKLGHPVLSLSSRRKWQNVTLTLMQGNHLAVAAVGLHWNRQFVNQPGVEAYKAEAKKMIVTAMLKGGFLKAEDVVGPDLAVAPEKFFPALVRWVLREDEKLGSIFDIEEYRRIFAGDKTYAFADGKIQLAFAGAAPESLPAGNAADALRLLIEGTAPGPMTDLDVGKGIRHRPTPEILYFGDTRFTKDGREMWKLLQTAATDLFRRPLQTNVDVSEAPRTLHEYHEAHVNEPKGISIILVPQDHGAPPMGRLSNHYIWAQALAVFEALKKAGRTVVIIRYPRNDDQGRQALAKFFERAGITSGPFPAGAEETLAGYRQSLEEMDILKLVAEAQKAIGDSTSEVALRGILPDPAVVDQAKKHIRAAQAFNLSARLLAREPLLEFLSAVWLAKHPPSAGAEEQPTYLISLPEDYRGPVAIVGKGGGTELRFDVGVPEGIVKGTTVSGPITKDPDETQDQVLDRMAELIAVNIRRFGANRIMHVHLSFPGWFNPDGSFKEGQENIRALKGGFHLGKVLEARLAVKFPRPMHLGPIPVKVVHDGTGHAMGELSRFGTHPGAKSLFFIGPGTGIGTRGIVNGEPFTGGERVDHFANEAPHTLVFTGDPANPDYRVVILETKGAHPNFTDPTLPNGRSNPLFGKEDLEDRTRGPAISAYAQELIKSGKFDAEADALKAYAPDGDLLRLDTAALGRAVNESRNAIAMKAIQERGRELGIGLAVMLAEFHKIWGDQFPWPDHIVLGGGVAQIGKLYFEAVRDGFESRLQRYKAEETGLAMPTVANLVARLTPSIITRDSDRELLAGLPSEDQAESYAMKLQNYDVVESNAVRKDIQLYSRPAAQFLEIPKEGIWFTQSQFESWAKNNRAVFAVNPAHGGKRYARISLPAAAPENRFLQELRVERYEEGKKLSYEPFREAQEDGISIELHETKVHIMQAGPGPVYIGVLPLTVDAEEKGEKDLTAAALVKQLGSFQPAAVVIMEPDTGNKLTIVSAADTMEALKERFGERLPGIRFKLTFGTTGTGGWVDQERKFTAPANAVEAQVVAYPYAPYVVRDLLPEKKSPPLLVTSNDRGALNWALYLGESGLEVWDIFLGHRVGSIAGLNQPANLKEFSSGVVVAGESEALVRFRLSGHVERVSGLKQPVPLLQMPDGRVLIREGDRLAVIDFSAGTVTRVDLEGLATEPLVVGDNRILVGRKRSAEPAGLVFVDTRDGTVVPILVGEISDSIHLAPTTDGKVFVAQPGRLSIFNPATWMVEQTVGGLKNFRETFPPVAFNGRTAVVPEADALAVVSFNAEPGKEITRVKGLYKPRTPDVIAYGSAVVQGDATISFVSLLSPQTVDKIGIPQLGDFVQVEGLMGMRSLPGKAKWLLITETGLKLMTRAAAGAEEAALVEQVVASGQLGVPLRENGRTFAVVPVSASKEPVARQIYVQAGLEEPQGIPKTVWILAYPGNLEDALRLRANNPPLPGAFFLLNNQVVNRQTAAAWVPAGDFRAVLADPRIRGRDLGQILLQIVALADLAQKNGAIFEINSITFVQTQQGTFAIIESA